MSEMERLKQRLKDSRVTNFHVFRGSNKDATDEDIAREVNKSLDAIERGEFEEVNPEECAEQGTPEAANV